MEVLNLYSKEGKQEIYKAAMELLKSNVKSINKVLNVIENFFPEEYEDVVNDYDDMVIDENDISITSFPEHVIIKLPEISSRCSEPRRLIYEDTLVRKLTEFKVRNNLATMENAIIIYEHMVNEKCRIKDNDNYNVMEQKNILDCIVTAGIIDTDKGNNCSLCHITSVKKDIKNHTLIHVINDNEKLMQKMIKV